MTAVVDPGFWAGRRVLVTGHTGFKGAWLVLWLKQLGANVSGFALPPRTEPALFTLARVQDHCTSAIGDLRDLAHVRAVVAEAQPEIVLHLAAQALVIDSIVDPLETLASNVMGTAHLLEAIRRTASMQTASVKTVLVVTSDKVYANDESGTSFPEDFPLGGKDPYSASKAATELVVRAWRETYLAKAGVRIATARGGNVIGGGDYAKDRIVPDVVRAIARAERPILRMPHATRPWQHVLDCLAGYLLYAQALARGEHVPQALNFGPRPGTPISVGDVATTMLAALGAAQDFEHKPTPGSVEMKTLAVDATRARDTLRWDDALPGHEAIGWTAAWYARVKNGEDALAVTRDQITAHGALCAQSRAGP